MKHLIIAKVVILLFCLAGPSKKALAQTRVDRPFQVQLNFSGVFIKTFGQAISDPEVERFDARKWAWPGIDIGYHLNRTFFIGYSFQPSRNHILEETWSLSYGPKDANIRVDYQSGNYHNLNLRISPFNNGFYASASLVLIDRADYQMQAERLADELRIGEGAYPTDMNVAWQFKNALTFGVGLGYQHIFNNGIAVGFGLLVPLISSPYYEDISFFPTNEGVSLNLQDKARAEEKVRQETFFYPIQFNLKVGFNF